jgi:predicted nucleic-acid-binding protein
MLAVDTDVLVRLVTNDEPAQARRAVNAIARNPIFVAKTVLLELEWVLRYSYELGREAILRALQGILGLSNAEVEDAANVAKALLLYQTGMDFADALHLASCGPAEQFGTFDLRLVRQAKRQDLVEVVAI